MEFSAHHIVGALESKSLATDFLGAAETQAKNVVIDSRKVTAGEIFVPLQAEKNDGHDFIEDACERGAAIFFCNADYFKTHKENISQLVQKTGTTAISVENTLTALQALGSHIRSDRMPGKVVGITGSVGKTSTKDLTYSALAPALKTHKSQNSENNHLGVPLTLCNAPKGTEALVAEVGSSSMGEIAALAKILAPDIGVVTNVGLAHTQGLGDLESVAKEKGDLLESLPKSGTVILNADAGGSLALANRTQAQVLSFGMQADSQADIVAKNISLDENLAATFDLSSPFGSTKVNLQVAGKLNVSNALAALGVAGVLGVDLDIASQGLSQSQISELRMDLKTRKDGLQIINDTYNANPVSMKAALLELKALPAKSHIAVVSTMLELGEIHDSAHKEIAEFAEKHSIQLVSFQEPAYGVETLGKAELKSFLSNLGKGDAVLFKASRAVGLEKMIEA